jgi:hypothetical protein
MRASAVDLEGEQSPPALAEGMQKARMAFCMSRSGFSVRAPIETRRASIDSAFDLDPPAQRT